MPVIDKLFINQFRNLKNQLIEPSSNINLFIANNAQGKTNLIEAIYYLGHNRSFKTKNLKEIIGFNTNNFQLSAKINKLKIKLEKSTKSTKITTNQQKIKNSSELSKILPIQIITADRGFIVNGAPKIKRSYLDWGVFHVKPDFFKSFKNYNKTLKNINSLLVNKKSNELDFWFLQLAKISKNINQDRSQYLQQLKKTTKPKNTALDPVDFDYKFYPGWPQEVNYLDAQSIYNFLKKNTKHLIKTKYLNYGPHKANINFFSNNKAEGLLSRGEQKTLSIVFWLTQVLMLIELGKKPIVLIDDISSELDYEKIKTVLSYLNALDIQIFITDINNTLVDNKDINTSVFFINNGVIKAK